MIENLQTIAQALQDRDLEVLYKLATPKQREINKKDDYRSVLMLSCNNLKHLVKIDFLQADAIILNLEDGVSREDKPFALVLCAIFLAHHKKSEKKLIVRVNALDNGGLEEIAYLNQFMPDAIRVPKIRSKEEVACVSKLLNDDIELHLSIETKEAWGVLYELKVDKKVKAFYLGVLDLFADMSLPHLLIDKANPLMLHVLCQFLLTCKSIGVKPISFVYQDFKNLDEFDAWITLEKNLGYSAKGCISPAQVEIVNKKFTQNEEEIEKAKKIVKLFEMHLKNGISGFSDEEFGFIDEPIYKGALVLLQTK